MKAVELINITKKYGEQEVLNSFSLDIEKGEMSCSNGRKWLRKKVLLPKIIIGLEKPNSGEVKILIKI